MKKKIIRVVLLFCFLIAFSCVILAIFWATGIITFADGFSFNIDAFKELRGYWWSWFVFFLIQVLFTTLLSFAPAGSMAFILLEIAVFGANWKTFLLAFFGVIVSSLCMDLIGRFGGRKIVIKLIGEEDYLKAEKLIKEKGISYLPLFYLFPLFPDDAICMIAGIIKVNFLYHIISIILCRGIGVATIVFGISLIPFEQFNSVYDWIVCITVIAFWVIVAFYIAYRINKYLEKKGKKKE